MKTVSTIKLIKFILPVLLLLFIINNSYSQLHQQSHVDSTVEIQKIIDEVQKLINLEKYDLALKKLRLSRKTFESAGDICAALAVDTWTAKICVFKTDYQQAITLLKNTKYSLEQLNCSSESLAFKDLDKIIIGLENHLKAMSFLAQNNTRDAFIYLQKARETYQELGEGGLAVLLTGTMGITCLDTKEYEKALTYFQETLQVGETIGNSLVKMLALGCIGCCHGLMGDHEKAKDFLDLSLDQTPKINITSSAKQFIDVLSKLVNEVARVYEIRPNYTKALLYHDYALMFNSLTDNLNLRAGTHGLMGMIYDKLYKFDKSLEHYQQSLQISENIKNLAFEEYAITSIAFIYKETGQYDKAIEYYKKSLKTNQRTKELGSKKAILEGLGLCNLNLNRNDEAIDYLMTLLHLCEKSDDTTCQLSTLGNLSICYEVIGNFNEAIKLEQNIITISQKISDQKRIAQASLALSALYRKLGDEYSAISSWFDAFKCYCEIEDRQAIIDNIFLSSENDYFRQKKYHDVEDYLKKELSSAEKNEDLKKQIFITILLADLNYFINPHDTLDHALQYYKAANQLNNTLQDPEFQRYILFGMANWYFYKNDINTALTYMNDLLRLAEKRKDIALHLDVINNMVDGYQAIGNLTEANKYNQQGLKIAQEAGEEKRQGNFYSGLGAINYILGNYQKAIEFRMKALAINREYGDIENALFELNSVAWAYFQINQFEQAMRYSNEALQGYIIIKNHEGVLNCLTLLIWSNSEMGNNPLAYSIILDAVKIIPYVKDYETLNEFYLVSGIVSMRLGDYQNALRIIVLSLYAEQIKERKNLNLIAEAYGAMGLTYIAMGDYKKGQYYVEKSLDFFRKANSRWGEAIALNKLALILGETKNYNEAFANLAKSEKIFQEIGNIKGQIESLTVKAFVSSKQLIERKRRGELVRDTQDILNDLQKALELPKEINDKNSEATILLVLGIYYFGNDEYDKARQILQDASLIAAQNFIPEVLVITNHQLGKILEREHKYSDALTYYQKAVVSIETLQSSFVLGFMKGKFLEKRREPYDCQFKLLLKLYHINADNKYKELSFTTCEKAKARSLLDSLNMVQASEPSSEEEKFSPIRDIEKRLSTIKSKLKTSEATTSPKYSLKKDVAILQDELALFKTLQQRQEHVQPSAKKLATPDIQYQEIQLLLDEKTIFVEYVFSEDEVYAWLITKDKFEIYELSIAPRKLEELVRNYRAILMKPQLSTTELSKIKLGQDLFKILLSPIENEILAGKKLIVVPDGPLHYLPFETLIIPQAAKTDYAQKGTQDIPYLIKETSIAYFHSGAVMVSLMKKPKTSPKNEKRQYEIVAFGDPVYSRKEQSEKNEVDRRNFYETRGVNFERLTYSSQEVETIAKIFNLDPTSECINLRERATEKRVYDLDLKNYRRIHFATHGILADEITWINQPALVLSLIGTDEKKYDGFLTMDEIYDLDLNADLVVLSACKTGLGEEIKGEGLVGLTHAFIHAGADSLVVSLWDVNDQSTSMLMESFYNHLKTMNKADALRNAKLDLINSKFTTSAKRGVGGITQGEITKPTCSHPYYWAPFILIGKYD